MSSSTIRLLCISAAVAGVLLPSLVLAQSIYTGANNGDWATGGNWSLGVPASGVDARINNNLSLVNVNLAASTTGNVRDLTIDAGDSLTILNNATLNIAGNLLANGTLKFISNPNESFLNFSSATATISGLIDFNYQTGSPTAGVIQGPGSGTLTNNGTIQGLGTLRNIRFTNSLSGLIDANDLRGQLYIDANNGGGGLFINAGTMRASAGGLLTIAGDNGGDVNSTGGNIQANGAGSIVRFVNSSSVTGGNYSTTGGGEIVVEAGHTGYASPQSLSGTLRVRNNATLNLSGAMANNGTIRLTTAGNLSLLTVNAPLTLSGTGSLVGEWSGSGAGPRIDAPSNLLTIGANQTQSGVLYYNNSRVVNNGLIDANSASAATTGSGIIIDPNNSAGGLFVNNGTMRSSAGGLLSITGDFGGDTINNGTISATGTGSISELYNSAAVTGGTWSNTSGGVIRVRPGHTGYLFGPVTLSSGSTFLVPANNVSSTTTLNANGTFTGGTIQLDAAGALSLLNISGDSTFTSGTLIRGTYTNVSNSPGPRIDTGGNTLTVDAGATIDGVVHFNNTRVVNNGTINANQAAGMYVDPNNQGSQQLFVNNNIMQATGGGLMQIGGDAGGALLNNGTLRAVGAGSIVELRTGINVIGGTISTSGGGVVRVQPGQTATLTGPATVSAGSSMTVLATTASSTTTLNVAGNYTLNGTLDLNANGALALLNVAGNTTLGTGTLNGLYTNVSNSPGPRVDTGANTLTVSNASTVQGVIAFNNARVINNGLIDANNVSGMFVDPNNQAAGLFVNNATMRSSNGGIMQISGNAGGDLINNGTISAIGTGSVTELVGSIAVTGGTWTNSGGGVTRVSPGQTAYLNSPTIPVGSKFDVPATATSSTTTLNLNGTLALNGTLDLQANGALSLLNVNGPLTVNGTGTLRGSYVGTGPGNRIDGFGNQITISATNKVDGVIHFNNLTVTNNGLIDANFTSTTAGMYVDPNNTTADSFVNSAGATMRSSNGGIMQLTGDAGGNFLNNGTISAIGTGSVTELVNNVSVTGGTWSNSGGGVIRVRPGNTATLVDPTVPAGSKFDVPATAASSTTTLNANGTYTLNGVLDMSAQGAMSYLNVNGPLTIAGSGSLRGSYSGTGPSPRMDGGATQVAINAGSTLEGVWFLNNVTVTNNGTILANTHAVPNGVGQFDMYIDAYNGGGGKFINNGTIRATNGAAIGFTGDAGGNPTGTGPLIVDAGSVIGTWNSCGGDMGPVSGAGTYRASNSSNLGHTSFRVASLEAINSATARVIAGATTGLPAGTSKVGTVVINTSGKIDLTNNGMIVTGMNQAAVRALIAPARNNGQWNGVNGIGSSLAFSNGKAIGYSLTSDIFAAPTVFLGQSAALTDVLVRYTFNGDTDLNGTVNFDDLLKLAQNYDTVATGTWRNGDSNYDGNINFDDLLALAQQYGKTLFVNSDQLGELGDVGGSAFTQDWAMALSLVPEPTSLSLLAGGMLLARRRR